MRVVVSVAKHTTLLAAPDPDEPIRPTNHATDDPDGAAAAPQGPEGLSVWVTAQSAGPSQRRGRHVPESVKHPARMLPAIAAHAITTYTRPGDLVLDPMCGIGTTLVEAVHAGRDAVGVEYESRWADIADANVTHAHGQGASGRASVLRGDATRLASLLPWVLHGQVALVVTSPPYGPAVHGLVRPSPGEGVAKFDNRYGDDKGNLAYQDLPGLLSGFTGILAGCAQLLCPGGVVVVTVRPWRKHGDLIDLPSAVIAAGITAGSSAAVARPAPARNTATSPPRNGTNSSATLRTTQGRPRNLRPRPRNPVPARKRVCQMPTTSG